MNLGAPISASVTRAGGAALADVLTKADFYCAHEGAWALVG